jgi:hypothetical protein
MLTICIPTFNRCNFLNDLLISIYNADKKCIMEPKTCLISNIADEFKMMSEKPYAIFSKLNKA